MPSELIEKWPVTLKTQLESSQSHLPLINLLGPNKSFVGIFEIFSRTPLPQGTKQVMARIPRSGSVELETKLGNRENHPSWRVIRFLLWQKR